MAELVIMSRNPGAEGLLPAPREAPARGARRFRASHHAKKPYPSREAGWSWYAYVRWHPKSHHSSYLRTAFTTSAPALRRGLKRPPRRTAPSGACILSPSQSPSRAV